MTRKYHTNANPSRTFSTKLFREAVGPGYQVPGVAIKALSATHWGASASTPRITW